MALPIKQKKPSFVSTIINLPQSCLIWFTGAKRKDLPEHLRKPYAGLGGMAMVSTTLATIGGYSFVLISLGSTAGAIPGAILAGYFMWGMDRSILGSAGNKSSQKRGKNSSPKGMWIKLAINVAFSSILTLPLSVYMQRGAVQKHNMKQITEDIEEVNREIEEQNQKIAIVEQKKADIDADWRKGNRADGSINEEYFKDKEEARQAVIDAKAEKSLLVNDKNELKKEYTAYERGDLSKVSLSFPEQFHYMMSQARWTDNLLNIAFFGITALMGSGAVLIKTFVFGIDSYTKKLQALEEATIHEQELKNALNISTQQIHHSLFNTDLTNDRIKTKIQHLQREFELETERMATWLYDERTKQMQQQIRQQAVAEDIEFGGFEFNSSSFNNAVDSEKQNYEQPLSDRNNRTFDKSRLSFSVSKKSHSDRNFPNKVKNRKKENPSNMNGKQITEQKEVSPKIAKDEDFMTLFDDIDRQIDLENN